MAHWKLSPRVVPQSFQDSAPSLGSCAAAFGNDAVFIERFVPETKGRDFSEIEAEVRARFGHDHMKEAKSY